jgi:hypothetical protein
MARPCIPHGGRALLNAASPSSGTAVVYVCLHPDNVRCTPDGEVALCAVTTVQLPRPVVMRYRWCGAVAIFFFGRYHPMIDGGTGNRSTPTRPEHCT